MIYLDSSVLLARIFTEKRRPPDAFWRQPFVSSQLLEYEVINRILVRKVAPEYLDDAHNFISRAQLLDLTPPILARALQPFPVSVRTLDGLHLASMDFLRAEGQTIEVATYDTRFATAATALGFQLAAL